MQIQYNYHCSCIRHYNLLFFIFPEFEFWEEGRKDHAIRQVPYVLLHEAIKHIFHDKIGKIKIILSFDCPHVEKLIISDSSKVYSSRE